MRLRRERGKRMKIIKRSGTEVVFDIDKIVNAIRAANL
ncbi:MAG: ATP cone domain-containing protein, partial [Collinsella sp.]